nr:FapA family protein [Candidatus Krumholzibacteria bacterium]
MSPVTNPGPAVETGVVDEVDRLLEDAAPPPPEYQLRVSSDKVRVVLDCPDPLADLTGNVNRIMADFGRLEIPVHPDPEQMAEILQKISTPGQHLVEKTIMMGQKSVPSQDGRLDWSRDFFTTGWAMDEATGAVDFWDKLEDLSVHEDELLVTLLHPVHGESGLNVFGIEIPVTKPAKVKLRCGKGVRSEETADGVAYFSNVDGRVRYTDGTVAVDDLFTVKGNVNLETGNIRHAGAVLIQGDVEAGATIEAEGDIIIKGMVDPCTIVCGGSLSVAGGLLGDGQSRITVEGDFNARYVNEAHVLVGGNVTVTNEISHSVIKARGLVSVPKGRVAGGLVQGFQGVRVAQAGASGTSDTKLVAGVDFQVQAQIDELDGKIKQLEQAQEKIAKAINDMKRSQDLDNPSVR